MSSLPPSSSLCKRMKQGTVQWPSERLDACPMFMEMSLEDMRREVDRLGACTRCLSWRHGPQRRCRGRQQPCKTFLHGGKRCLEVHHRVLHAKFDSSNASNM